MLKPNPLHRHQPIGPDPRKRRGSGSRSWAPTNPKPSPLPSSADQTDPSACPDQEGRRHTNQPAKMAGGRVQRDGLGLQSPGDTRNAGSCSQDELTTAVIRATLPPSPQVACPAAISTARTQGRGPGATAATAPPTRRLKRQTASAIQPQRKAIVSMAPTRNRSGMPWVQAIPAGWGRGPGPLIQGMEPPVAILPAAAQTPDGSCPSSSLTRGWRDMKSPSPTGPQLRSSAANWRRKASRTFSWVASTSASVRVRRASR